MVKNILVTVMVLFIFGCASNNSETMRYYSLTLSSNDDIAAQSEGKVRVVIDDVELPRFLKQDSMVIQLDKNEIYTANYNRWAEPLDVGISKLMVTQLNAIDDNYAYERSAGEWNKGAIVHLRIEFSEFHARVTGDVSVTGRLWVYDSDKSQIVDRSFRFVEPVVGDGYAAAVVSLRSGVLKLSNNIASMMPER
ncbi:MAG: putative lipoprotein YmbA [Candidatus Azotimanducaceae bacterium]|jgi:uncharacterized lipoprotein YmbA